MTAKNLQEILRKHTLWLNGDPDGEKADLSDANLSGANLYGVDLRRANLYGANLCMVDLRRANLHDTNLGMADLYRAGLYGANLCRADLHRADLRGVDLRRADLSGVDLCRADLNDANLSGANLSDANMSDANLSGANINDANINNANLSGVNLSGANLSGANGLLSAVNFMEANFERTENGYIAYKTFCGQYTPPEKWKIKPGSIIEENVNFDRCNDCGCGINVAPIKWVKDHYIGDIWKVLIRWEWLAGVCVPYNSKGKIRCERVELIEIVK